jgi:hypothetical protein
MALEKTELVISNQPTSFTGLLESVRQLTNTEVKKKSKLSRKLSKIVREAVSEELEVYDINKWKLSCKGFGPIHYQTSTRKQWFKKNQYRIEGAREIVDFVNKWVVHFRSRD